MHIHTCTYTHAHTCTYTYGQCPHLKEGKRVVPDEGEDKGGRKDKLQPESVVVAVIRGLELEVDEVDRGGSGGDEQQLHHRVVQ